MLTLYRRHLRACPHRLKAREYKRCKCPIWVGGTHFGMEVRKSLDTTAWEEAEHRLDVMKKTPAFTFRQPKTVREAVTNTSSCAQIYGTQNPGRRDAR